MSTIAIRDLGLLPYRDAWRMQEETHAAVVAGSLPATLLIVEHPPVITFGRRAELSASHLVASADLLAGRGVEVVESDRGGDITFHGPGQLVAYPILRLAEFGLSVGSYVRLLQDAVVAVCHDLGVPAVLDPGAIGVWVPLPADSTALGKVCAVGVRVKSGATLHGLALNITTDLSFFDLIVPCGLAERPVTSLRQLLGPRCPSFTEVAERLATELSGRLVRRPV